MKKVTRAFGYNLVNFNDKAIGLTIRFSNRCNYSCDYCHYHDNSEPFQSEEYYINYINLILKEMKEKEEVRIYVHGGEPTIVPGFINIVKEMLKYKNVKDIIVQTNTSLPISYFNKFVEIYDNRLNFSCSYQHHMNTDFDKYYEKIQLLLKHNLLYLVNVSLESSNSKDIQKKIKIFNSNEKLYGKIIYNFIEWDNNNFEKYDDVKDIIEKSFFEDKEYAVEIFFNDGSSEKFINYNELRLAGYNRFKNYTCTAGNKNLVFQPNGDVFYCLSHEAAGNPCSNIFTNNKINEIINRNVILCRFSKCDCELWLEKKKLTI